MNASDMTFCSRKVSASQLHRHPAEEGGDGYRNTRCD
jgi:hypothetical protein